MKLLGSIFLIAKLSVLSPDNVSTYIKRQGIAHPNIVLAQTIQECGYEYNSHNARVRNNICGMKGGVKCEENKLGYAIYPHWFESVKGYKYRQRTYTTGSYFKYLVHSNYSESKKYIADLKWHLKRMIGNDIKKTKFTRQKRNLQSVCMEGVRKIASGEL